MDRDEIHEQEISVTCELKNGIKELNNEIKRLYDSLTRLDERMNREKRGLNERTAIADCVQMKGKFKKIYEDLNRISETLSLIDENGICRCKCPLVPKIPPTSIPPDTGTAVTRTTTGGGDPQLPLELTTFALDKADDEREQPPRSTGKTKQLKKIIVTDYDPQVAANCLNQNKYRCDTDHEDTVTETTAKDDDPGTTEDTATTPVVTAETSTVVLHSNNQGQTYEEPQTVYSEIVTKIYKDERLLVTSKKPKGSTGPIENTETTTEFEENGEDRSTTPVDDEVFSRSTTEYEENFSTTETLVQNAKTGRNFTKNVFESTSSGFDISSDSTTKLSDSGKNDARSTTDENSESTTLKNENVFDSTTTRIKSDSGENFSVDSYYVTEKSFDSDRTTSDENVFQQTTQTIVDRTRYDNSKAKVTADDVSNVLTSSENKIISTTTETTSVVSDKIVDVTGRDSAEDRDKNRPAGENRKPDKTGNQQQPPPVVQPSKWYPVCFYPVPCSPDAADYLPDAQHVVPKNNIQYSSQSLNAYKKKASLADATVIQNNYPIISYCPKGMVCSKSDFAGQPNVLHCMMTSSTNHDDGTTMPLNLNGTDESNVPKQPIKTVYNEMKSPTTTRVKIARDSDEIITG